MNKIVLITGCNGGLGRSLVKKFSQNKYRIIACARKFTDEFDRFVLSINKTYSSIIDVCFFDMDDKISIGKSLDDIQKKYNIDILVNNAGITDVSLFLQTTIDRVEYIFSVNFFAQLVIMQKVLKKMMLKRKGIIINICSLQVQRPDAGRLAYACSKSALATATKVLSKEFGKFGIRINGVAPGPIETNLLANYSETSLKKYKDACSMKRFAKPSEISDAILFLASDKSSFVNGEIIAVDGGI